MELRVRVVCVCCPKAPSSLEMESGLGGGTVQ